MTGDPLVAALDYASHGLPVIPVYEPDGAGGCSCRRHDCGHPAKHPRLRRGMRDATTDRNLICGLWSQWARANVGVLTGTPGGIFVVDVDSPKATETMLELADGRPLGGLAALTARGKHLWYLVLAGITIRSFTFAPDVHIRGLGSYVVAPPSLHISGRRYRFDEGSLGPPPEWLLEALLSTDRPSPSASVIRDDAGWEPVTLERDHAYGAAVLARRCAVIRAEPVGSRNYALLRSTTKVAGFVASGVLDAELAQRELLRAALDAGLGEPEARRTIRSGFERGLPRPLYPPRGEAA